MIGLRILIGGTLEETPSVIYPDKQHIHTHMHACMTHGQTQNAIAHVHTHTHTHTCINMHAQTCMHAQTQVSHICSLRAPEAESQ